MRILVTGVAGFIGFHLTKTLCELGHKVVGVDNINDYYDTKLKYNRLKEIGFDQFVVDGNNLIQSKKYENLQFIKLDIVNLDRLQDLFSRNSFTQVIHLAAQAGVRYSIENPSTYIQSNLVGFGNILEMCRHFKVAHLLFASSSSVYGNSNDVPFSEDQNVDQPVSLYAATKKSNELMAYTYSHLYKFQLTGLRFFTVYGPWGRPDMAPMLFASAITQNKPINVFNKGNMLRDFTYIDDIIKGIIGCLSYENTKKPSYEIFNIGNSKPINLMDFISYMEEELQVRAEMNMMPMQAGDVKVTYADTNKLKKEIGYSPSTNLKKGLHEFVKWYKSYYEKR